MDSLEEKIKSRIEKLKTESSDIICFFNSQGIIISINPDFSEFSGKNKDEFTGKHVSDFIRQGGKDLINEILEDENGLNTFNHRMIDIELKKGSPVRSSLSAEILYDAKGNFIEVLGVVRDVRGSEIITDFGETYSRYKMLADNISDVLWTTDMAMNITYMSSSIYNALGYTPEEMLTIPKDKIFTAESIKKYISVLREELDLESRGTVDPRRSRTIELQEITKDGNIIDVEMKAGFLRDRNGKAVGMMGVTRDITERKKAEEALRRSEEKYRRILEDMEDAYYEVDLSGTYVYANKAACKIFGYEQSEIIGMNYKDQYKKEYSKRVYDIFTTIYKTEEPVNLLSWDLIRKDGQIKTIEASVSLLYDSDGNKTGFCGIARDMTERIKMNETLKKNEHELRKRNEEVEKDLQTAQFIIKSIFTEEVPEYGNLKIDYRYYPLEALGGDYFSFKKLQEGGLSIFLADVASHGVSAALFLSLIKATTDRVYHEHALVPRNFIQQLNKELLGNMPLSFLTAIYGLFLESEDGNSCIFSFTASGHPYPVLYRSAKGSVDYLECKGPLIGKLSDIKVEQKRITLNKGDRLFLYTDGLPETMNSNEELLGYDELLNIFKVSMKKGLGDSLDEVIQQINTYRGAMPFDDDIILLGFEL